MEPTKLETWNFIQENLAYRYKTSVVHTQEIEYKEYEKLLVITDTSFENYTGKRDLCKITKIPIEYLDPNEVSEGIFKDEIKLVSIKNCIQSHFTTGNSPINPVNVAYLKVDLGIFQK